MDQWFSAQAGSFDAGQNARQSVEGNSCASIRNMYAAGQAVAGLFG
jgi:hypothetical protein